MEILPIYLFASRMEEQSGDMPDYFQIHSWRGEEGILQILDDDIIIFSRII